MLDEARSGIDRGNRQREFKTSIEDIARRAGISVIKTGKVLYRFVTRNRLELFATHMVVKNINDLARFVNSRRNQM